MAFGRNQILLLFFLSCGRGAAGTGLPVTAPHPRILLTPAVQATLLAKKNANDPAWIALQSQADTLATYSIFPYIYATRTQEPDSTIFYDYQGSGWYDAALPLALAYQMTGDTTYSNQLLALADEIIAAQTRPENTPPTGLPPLEPDSYYPTRFVGPVLAIIFDWCYDQLGSTRKAQMIALMNTDFDDMRVNAYQADDHADGNYFGGHLLCAAMMGYASSGDNPRAQEMIDYARIRFDGSTGSANVPSSFVTQVFDGGYPSSSGVAGAPFSSGFDFQGWAYGTGEYERLIDYLLAVRSSTGEDLIAAHQSWFSKIFHAEKEGLFPNHFEIDPSGDWGGDQGAVIPRDLPARLAFLLAGTPDGPGAESFAYSEISDSTFSDVTVYPLDPWVDFLFSDSSRPSASLHLPAFYTGFGPAYPQGNAGNGALPHFLMRSGDDSNATWGAAHLGTAFYDDHQHKDAGHLTIFHGNDYLLVDASSFMGAAGSEGIVGGSTEADNASSANTLFFDDFGDYMYTGEDQYYGGQGDWGTDSIVADELNDAYSYVRSDLASAYDNASGDATGRKLLSFYRNFVYLRPADLFVVYDEVAAANSSNARGQYVKYLRWHLPNVPTVSGSLVTVDQGASRLYLDTIAPPSASLTAIDESNNPDCDDSQPGCPSWPAYINNSGTWRIEVRDPANPLTEAFLTILQTGDTSRPAMTDTLLTSDDSLMTGVEIVQPGGQTNVVFFNNQAGQTPAPLTSTSYSFSGPSTAVHTLAGFVPGAKYRVAFAAGTVNVTQDPAGNGMASLAGVLQFTTASLSSARFYTVAPCRLLDTRRAAGTYGGPAFQAGDDRDVPFAGQCGIPSDAVAVAANLTVVSPTSHGDIDLSPTGPPFTVSTLNFSAGRTRANNAVIGLSASGHGSLRANMAAGQTHLLIDISGYFR